MANTCLSPEVDGFVACDTILKTYNAPSVLSILRIRISLTVFPFYTFFYLLFTLTLN